MIVISDIHGCYNTLIRLMNKCPEGPVIFAGDLIDRGPHSKAVVEFAMNNKIPVTMGNHCDLALDYSKHHAKGFKSHCGDMYDYDVWIDNGGDDCLESFGTFELPDNVLQWMQDMPAYIKHDNLLVSHTGYGLSGVWMNTLWGRHSVGDGEFPDDGLFRVFGHTQEKNAVITDKWAMIDTGAAYYMRGMGILTAFEWPSKALYSERFEEKEHAVPNFTIVDGCIVRNTA